MQGFKLSAVAAKRRGADKKHNRGEEEPEEEEARPRYSRNRQVTEAE
jgi:hypothetical protein